MYRKIQSALAWLSKTGGRSSEASGALLNGDADNSAAFAFASNPSTQGNHVAGVPSAPPSLFGMPAYLPPGQISQSGAAHAGQFHSLPAISSLQHWQNQQQGISGAAQVSTHNQYPSSRTEQNVMRSDANHNYDMSVIDQSVQPNVHISQAMEPSSAMPSSTEAVQEKSAITTSNHGLESIEQLSSAASINSSDRLNLPVNYVDMTTAYSATGALLAEPYVSTGQTNTVTAGNLPGAALLGERSLLACIVRTIPPVSGGRICISSTLLNRLSKMLAPLNWHDYKRKYGKLDDFVAGHPEVLFVIEGDSIQLREGAQEIVAATAAVAKVAAAASASSPSSKLLPSVTVTPMAQSHRLKKVPLVDSKSVKAERAVLNELPCWCS